MYVSPYVEIDQSKSSIEFRVSGLNIRGYAILEEGKSQKVSESNFTSDKCATFRSQLVKKPKKFLEIPSKRRVQLVILTSSSVYIPIIGFSFEQRGPPKYSSVAGPFDGSSNEKPRMKTMGGDVDRCSFEWNENKTVDCDWLLLESRDEFELVEAAPCFRQGLRSVPKGEKRFIALKGVREDDKLVKTAYALSPIVRLNRRGRVEISLFTAMTCYGGHVKVYFVPTAQTDDVRFVTSQYEAVIEVRRRSRSWEESQMYVWEQSHVMLEDVEPNKDYQVNF